MKKVLIFSLAYYPRVGGAEVAIKEITDRISDIEFHMVTLRFGSEPKQEKIGNVLVHRVGFGGTYVSKMLFVLLAAFKARSLHRMVKFDAAWAMMSYMLIPLVLLRVLGVKIPYALTLQEGDTYEHMFSRPHIVPFLPLINSGFKHAKVIQAISTYLGGWAYKRGFTGKVEVVPNGVDIKNFHITFEPHDGVVLITTSRLVRKNAIDVVIRALPKLPDVLFEILGGGPEEESLKKLAKKLGVTERVTFKGYIPHSEMPEHLRKADIFIRPSRSEGMGNSFIEAMAAGLPVIATQEGGIADFLFDAKKNPGKPTTGWAVDVDGADQIVAAVKEILGNSEATKKVIDNARALALREYDWGIVTQNMRAKVFEKLF